MKFRKKQVNGDKIVRNIKFKNYQDYTVEFTSGWTISSTENRWGDWTHTFTMLIYVDIYEQKTYKNIFGRFRINKNKISTFSVEANCGVCQFEIKTKHVPTEKSILDDLHRRFWSLQRTLEIDWLDEKIRDRMQEELSLYHKRKNQQVHYAIDCGGASEHLEEFEAI